MMERRLAERLALDAPCFIEADTAKGRLPVMLCNVSPGGAMIGLPPGEEVMAVGDMLRLRAMPASLAPFSKGVSGRVMWCAGNRCGVQFDMPLPVTTEALRTLLLEMD